MLKVTLHCELPRSSTDSPIGDTPVFLKIGNTTQGLLVKREIKDSSGITDVTGGVGGKYSQVLLVPGHKAIFPFYLKGYAMTKMRAWSGSIHLEEWP